MEPNTIDLFGHRLARRVVAAFRVLIGSHPVPDPTAGPTAGRTQAGAPR
jgi:hypothetical protein